MCSSYTMRSVATEYLLVMETTNREEKNYLAKIDISDNVVSNGIAG